MKTTTEWITHFRENLKEHRINWCITPSITQAERNKIVRSLQTWQRAEQTTGVNLIRVTEKYAVRYGDPACLEAIKLFIKEEQKHGENLGKYLDAIGEKRLIHDLSDTLFRKARHINSNMELWTISVIIAESFAQWYYKSLAEATHCPLLKQICADILKDEAHHIKFQLERLCIIAQSRSELANSIVFGLYQAFFYFILGAVWLGHHKVFKAGGLSFHQLFRKSTKRTRFILNRIKQSSPVYIPIPA